MSRRLVGLKLWMLGTGLACTVLACTTDTRGLAYRPETEGHAGAGGARAGVVLPTDLRDDREAEALLPAPDALTLPSAGGSIQLLNGLVNVEQLFLCRERNERPEAEDPPGLPLTALAFAEAFPLATGRTASSSEIRLQLYAAQGRVVAGITCRGLQELSEVLLPVGEAQDGGVTAQQTDAAVPPLQETPEVVDLGQISLGPEAFGPGRHYVVVPTGCAEFPSSVDFSQCGAASGSDGRRLQILSVAMGRAPSEGVGLQFLHASRSMARAEVLLGNESQSGPAVRLAAFSSLGSVRPAEPARFDVPGAALDFSVIGLRLENSLDWDFSQSWANAVRGLSTPLRGAYLLVYVGLEPSADRTGPLHPPQFVVLQAGELLPE